MNGDATLNPPNPKQRYGDRKVPLGLIPSAAKVYAALALKEGAKKYGAYNWRDKAVEAMTYIHAAERHLSAWVDGEDIDEDSGCPHLGHAIACLSILADATEVGNLIDNRPLPAPTGDLLEEWAAVTPLTDEEAEKLVDWLEEEEDPIEMYKEAAERYREIAAESLELADRLIEMLEKANLAPCPLDGRNCPPDHDHFDPANPTARIYLDKDHPAFGEGDETRAYDPCIHRWRDEGEFMVCSRCGAEHDVVDLKPGQHAIDFSTPETMKHPCWCDRGRCKIENGHPVGNNVFCCRAEANC